MARTAQDVTDAELSILQTLRGPENSFITSLTRFAGGPCGPWLRDLSRLSGEVDGLMAVGLPSRRGFAALALLAPPLLDWEPPHYFRSHGWSVSARPPGMSRIYTLHSAANHLGRSGMRR